MKKKTKAEIIAAKQKQRQEKMANLPPEVPVSTNNFFTCNPICVKSTNTPAKLQPRDVEEVKSVVNGEEAKPKKRVVELGKEANKFIPTIDINSNKGSKKKN